MAQARARRMVLTGVNRGLGLTQALAQELPSGMAAVALNPGIIDTQMLRSRFGQSASSYPDAADWGRRAVRYLLKISAQDNGAPLTVPSR